MIRDSEQHLLEQLIASPKLPQYAQQLQAVLAREVLKRQDFYNQISEDDKAEFINGEIILHSPVRLRHNTASGNLYRLLSSYVIAYDLGYVGHEKIMVSLTRNDYEPDVCYFAKNTASQFQPDQMRFPAPDLAVEVVSKSTEANDRGIKFADYAAHGVQEYWIIDPEAETVEQYQLEEGEYVLQVKAKTGTIESTTVAGFIIPIRAIFDETVSREALRMLLRG
ncbi:MAG: Uma2 family endonuclease [Ardenticatenaceae bacterium]|nr:Uma2 family endonuclease [Ardenticatenaceae bacterium]